MQTLHKHDLAYFDSFSGLIPALVTDIKGLAGLASTAQRVTLTITANRRGYHKGESLETSGLHAVPRGSVRVRSGSQRIAAFQVDAPIVDWQGLGF